MVVVLGLLLLVGVGVWWQSHTPVHDDTEERARHIREMEQQRAEWQRCRVTIQGFRNTCEEICHRKLIEPRSREVCLDTCASRYAADSGRCDHDWRPWPKVQ